MRNFRCSDCELVEVTYGETENAEPLALAGSPTEANMTNINTPFQIWLISFS
jgi:hypothetical protein